MAMTIITMAMTRRCPRLTFKKKSGGTFTKTFKSLTTAKRAVSGWKAAGGRMGNKRK
jgi:hypothetical protein